MKLFIDDIRNSPESGKWVVARTNIQAIKTIARFKSDITVISIDHDISHQVHIDKLSRPYPCNECFCSVAYYIGAVYKPDELEIIIHSSNPVAGKEMVDILQDYGLKAEYIPSGTPANRLEMENKLV